MIRATTPTHTFTLPIDPTTCEKIIVVYSQFGEVVLKKEETDMTLNGQEKTVSYILSQEETKLFSPGLVQIQVRVKQGSTVMASKQIDIPAREILDDEVI